MSRYSSFNAWLAKVSNRISRRHRLIAAFVVMLGWGASIIFRWPVEPVFFFVLAMQLALSSVFVKNRTPQLKRKPSRRRLKCFEIEKGEVTHIRFPASRVDMNHIAKPDGFTNGCMPNDQRAQSLNALHLPLFKSPS
jgi:hypothetical protein